MAIQRDMLNEGMERISYVFGMGITKREILRYMLKKMNDENEITIAMGARVRMIDALDISIPALEKALFDLVEAGVIENPCKAVYIVSPAMFGLKSEWRDDAENSTGLTLTLVCDKNGAVKILGGLR